MPPFCGVIRIAYSNRLTRKCFFFCVVIAPMPSLSDQIPQLGRGKGALVKMIECSSRISLAFFF